MTYKDILTRVANNLRLPSITSAFLSVAKRDIYDVLCVLIQEHEFITTEINIPITTAITSVDLSTYADFFSPLELVFLDSDGNRLYTKEILPETYLKWNPTTEYSVESFNELITDATPSTILYSAENEQLDGYVGYTFTDDFVGQLKWKPAINGSIQMVYVRAPILQDIGYGFNYGFNYGSSDLLGFTPPLNPAFHTMIVESLTVKSLYRMLLDENLTEVRLIALRSLIKEHQSEFKKQSDTFAAFIKKTATFEAKSVEFFDFLNDRSMLLE
jgi:hypothetical protein